MISIIIPLYNVEQYIIECLKSFEKQLYKEFELIIVNDGSTDNSVEIAENYLKNSQLIITIINQQNFGVSAARNRGIEEAKGEFICFVDSDDMVGPYYLLKMISLLKKENCDLVFCSSSIVPEEYKFNNNDLKHLGELKSEIKIMDSITALKSFLYKGLVSGIGTMLIKKEILDNECIRFKEGYRYSEDQEIIWRIISKSNLIASINNPQYLYRIRDNSAMSVVDNKRLDGFKLMLDLEEYFQIEKPNFYKEFKKFGVARWVWATTWQIAIGSKDYKSFYKMIDEFQFKEYMKNLIFYPQNKVKISSVLFMSSPSIYYLIVKYFIGSSKNIRHISS